MNILLNGANGKMSGEVIKANNTHKIVCGFDVNESLDKQFPIYNDINKIKEKIDMIIDFSKPQATLSILNYALKNKTPIVIATTGFSKEEEKIIENYAKKIPIFKSANMSLSVNLMAKLANEMASKLKDTDIEIIETHHNRKIDAPSGTAILLADSINKAFDNQKEYNFNRLNQKKARDKNEIGFSSIRGGNIAGEHTVIFFSDNESLEITHKAYNRQIFAEGALKAAEFLIQQKPGLYDMNNLL